MGMLLTEGVIDSVFERLQQEGNTFFLTFVQNCAQYHKKCRNRYDSYHQRRKKVNKNKNVDEPSECTSHRATRTSFDSTNFVIKCFFCDLPDETSNVHQVMTFRTDNRVREGAKLLSDKALLAKLAEGDMVAIEAKYHRDCLS